MCVRTGLFSGPDNGRGNSINLEPISKCSERRRGKAEMVEKAEFTRSK